VLLLFPLIVEQSTTIAAAVPGYYQSLREWMVNYPNQLIVRLSEFLPATLPSLGPVQQTGQEMLASPGRRWVTWVWRLKASLSPRLILVWPFTGRSMGREPSSHCCCWFQMASARALANLISAMETKVGSYIAGQGILCLVIGILALVAYLLIGLPNALVLALMAGLLEAVPMIGPLLGRHSCGAGHCPVHCAGQAGLGHRRHACYSAVENSLLVPRVMRKAVGVNPFVSCWRFLLLAPCSALPARSWRFPWRPLFSSCSIASSFVRHAEPEVSAGRDYASRLRYEAQDLAQDLRKQARLKKGGSDLRVKQTIR
jgi:hypothetical protein